MFSSHYFLIISIHASMYCTANWKYWNTKVMIYRNYYKYFRVFFPVQNMNSNETIIEIFKVKALKMKITIFYSRNHALFISHSFALRYISKQNLAMQFILTFYDDYKSIILLIYLSNECDCHQIHYFSGLRKVNI